MRLARNILTLVVVAFLLVVFALVTTAYAEVPKESPPPAPAVPACKPIVVLEDHALDPVKSPFVTCVRLDDDKLFRCSDMIVFLNGAIGTGLITISPDNTKAKKTAPGKSHAL